MKLIKNLTTIILLNCVAVFTTTAQTVGVVKLKGELKGFNNQVNVEDISAFQYLLPPKANNIIVPDSAGRFRIQLKLTKPNYYRLGRNILYLSPGDDLEVMVDYRDPNKATFKGKGASANSYLKNTPFPKGGSFIAAGEHVKETPEATCLAIESLARLREKELAATPQITPEFRRLETARIKADLINSYMNGGFYSTYKLKLKDEAGKEFLAKYQKVIEPKVKLLSKNFTDASLLQLVVYRDIADEVIKEGGKPADIQQIKDFDIVSALVRKMQKESDKQLLANFKTEIAVLKTPSYQAAANQMLSYLMAFGKGDQAVDFMVLTDAGNKVNLSSLKGKVIYVDLWATWCGPCMQEMPAYEKLKQKYASQPDVAFVSLSIDDSEALWKESLTQRKTEGYQWLINRSKLQAYNIVTIPRSLLIDKNFKMVDMNAPMPSQPAAIKAIDELLK
ncbi:TlpA disulfide reductase family protein [Pedobacter sp. Hv1]|uniref:TlpA family protein disulfide reductase n=1 Tax=Pedobacter sp. Hv1 TaxID=1740090 RepID=UPI0006D891CA|nr:TlpA disulfide reductase family protein [Pedobacter sp. Hv1]KQB99381.1 hypothetical protein AQF98_17565 [Pedobacter sp. Hv1]